MRGAPASMHGQEYEADETDALVLRGSVHATPDQPFAASSRCPWQLPRPMLAGPVRGTVTQLVAGQESIAAIWIRVESEVEQRSDLISAELSWRALRRISYAPDIPASIVVTILVKLSGTDSG